jgi:hypothetical protein
MLSRRLFVPLYKACCMTSIVVNLFLLYEGGGFREHTTWEIAVVTLLLNLVSWMLFSQRLVIGRLSEQILSLGRTIVVLLAALVFFADIIALYSPVGLVLWLSLLRITQVLSKGRFLVWWFGCAVLLAMEISYFRGVSVPFAEPDRPEEAQALNQI